MIRSLCSRSALMLALLAGWSLPAHAQTPARLPDDKIKQIEAAIAKEMEQQKIPGLSVAVVADQQLVWSKGFGFADLENEVPAKATTVYRLASISKPITAVAVMQLAERGKLDLDAPIQKYVPDFPEKPWPITCRQLLGHLGGVRHYKSPEEVNGTRHYDKLVQGLDLFKNDPLLHEPGTKFSYTTYGYNLLGCAIEGTSGKSYVEYVRGNILKPAGMDKMQPDDVFAIIPNRAQGYRKNLAGELRNSPLADTSCKIPGGGWCSTVEDLAKFAIAVQTDKLVKKETRAQMLTRQKTKDGTQTAYGLGWNLAERNSMKEVAHNGGQPRVSTSLYMIPEQRCAVVVMTNLEGAKLNELVRQIADTVVEKK